MGNKNKAHKTRGRRGRRYRKRHIDKPKPLGVIVKPNKQNQTRRRKDNNATRRARCETQSATVPVVVAIVPLSSDADCQSIRSLILSVCTEKESIPAGDLSVVELPGAKKTRWKLYPILSRSQVTLELLRVFLTAELVIFVVSPGGIDAEGCENLRLFKNAGKTSFVTAIQTQPDTDSKSSSATKKSIISDLSYQLGDDVKVFVCSTVEDCRSMLHHVQPQAVSVPTWRRERPSVLVESVQKQFTSDTAETCSVALSGFVRYAALSVNQVVSMAEIGDFAIDKVIVKNEENKARWQSMEITETILSPDPRSQHSLVRENVFVPEKEMESSDQRFDDKEKEIRHVPKGTSEYQAAWIPTDDLSADSSNDNHSEDMESVSISADDIDAVREAMSNAEEMSVEDDSDCFGRNEEMDVDELLDAQEDDKQFPDEVHVPADTSARKRFQHYRGLKSFRTSPWDARIDLPEEYSRIFEFDSFAHASKSAKKEIDRIAIDLQTAALGTFVTVVLKDVPVSAADAVEQRNSAFQKGNSGPLWFVGLMRNEAKMSVLHYRVSKTSQYESPIANNEQFLFVSGFRWFEASALFSTDTPRQQRSLTLMNIVQNIVYFRSDKHKMEKFLHPGVHSIASVYGQIMFPPMPLLVFKLGVDNTAQPRLAFTGTLQSCAPERVILKQVILTGLVSKAFKKRAVIKGMFHNPDDIRWFKPLELWTKCGRTGYIKESLGTKGLMKCYFDGNIQHHDTVCMSLYKRVFPNWPETTMQR